MIKVKRLSDNYPFLISVIIHTIAFFIVMSIPIHDAVKKYGSPINIEWVKNLPEPKLKQAAPPKELIQLKKESEKKMKDGSKKKTILATKSDIVWVLKKSDRKVTESVELNKFPRREAIPDIMTASQLKTEDSNLSSLISTKVGPVDGNGVVGNQVRAKGTGGEGTKSGATIIGLGGKGDGTWGDGTRGSGGGRGSGDGDGLGIGKKLLDQLGIIDFLGEHGGAQKIIYCLDVSASMAIGSKLSLSIKSIKESLLQLDDFDKFNIVTFYANVRSFKDDAVPATANNIEKARKFLDSFTAQNIEANMGTDILGALRFALNTNPDVIVLVTDIQPTKGEIDPEKLVEEVKKLNKNTKIYGVGIEVWEPLPTGKLAKLLKMLTEQNNGEMRLAKSG
jgi:hypothetical protein